MTTLSILVEAAKLIEYDEGIYKNRKKSMTSMTLAANEQIRLSKPGYPMVQCPKKNSSYARYTEDIRRGSRETHNILEKNRRAEMKNYFSVLKSNLPKLRDMVKASNVSILTDAVKHIQELTETDRNYQIEKAVLRKCQSNLEERIKMLKEDIRRQHFCAQLFVQVQEEMERVQDSSSPKMMSVEVQANENDIKAEMPIDRDGIVEKCQRSCLSDLRNDLSQNGQSSSSERLSNVMNSKGSQATSAEIESCAQSLAPLACLSSDDTGGSVIASTESVGVQCKISKHNGKAITRRKRKLLRETDDTDSDSDLKIILDDE